LTVVTSTVAMGVLIDGLSPDDLITRFSYPQLVRVAAIAIVFNACVLSVSWLSINLSDGPHWLLRLGVDGWLRLLAGANLLALTFALANLSESKAVTAFVRSLSDLVVAPFWICVLLVFFVAFRQGIRQIHRGLAMGAVGAHAAMLMDKRAPVVYIRSFMLDGQLPGLYGAFTVEQELCTLMARFGPVVAIGKPGEPFPELGAARVYTSDDEWQTTIVDYFNRAGHVLVQVGPTANLWWEIDQARECVPLDRLLIVLLGQQADTAGFTDALESRFGPMVRPPGNRPMRWSPAWTWLVPGVGVELGLFIHFPNGRSPKAESISYPMSLKNLVMSPFIAPYRPLLVPLRRAFAATNLAAEGEWLNKKSQWAAVLLALYVGLFGAHHFYLGRSREGWLSVVFCWTMLPMLLGWVQCVKMVCMDAQTFDLLVQRHSARHVA
jgi:TM2 domain-containing membrane protein YozV